MKCEYDERGNVISVTYPGGGKYTYERDGRNNMVSMTRPDGGKYTYEHDERNNLISKTCGGEHFSGNTENPTQPIMKQKSPTDIILTTLDNINRMLESDPNALVVDNQGNVSPETAYVELVRNLVSITKPI